MQIYKLIPIVFVVIAVPMLVIFLNRQGVKNSSPSIPVNDAIESNTSDNTQASSSFIEQLRQREFTGGKITIEETLSNNDSYTSYIFSYPSDGLKIYGKMNIPIGAGPFPVIVLNHGYFNQSSFRSGDGTDRMANILAAKGYLTLASDYRGFGNSENDPESSRGHNPNYALDILNLTASIKSISQADTDNIGMWGHSMGGEMTLRAAEATNKLKAIVLWAPTSANASDNANFYGGGRHTQSTPNPENENISPINYLQYISAPISLHQGLSDTEVKPEWSKELNAALKKEGKKVEYFEYEGQDHNFQNLGWDLISARTLQFFDKNLK